MSPKWTLTSTVSPSLPQHIRLCGLTSPWSLPLESNIWYMSYFSQFLAPSYQWIQEFGFKSQVVLFTLSLILFSLDRFSLFFSPIPQLTIHLLDRKLKDRLWGQHKKKYKQMEEKTEIRVVMRIGCMSRFVSLGPAHPFLGPPVWTLHSSGRAAHRSDQNRQGPWTSPVLLMWVGMSPRLVRVPSYGGGFQNTRVSQARLMCIFL